MRVSCEVAYQSISATFTGGESPHMEIRMSLNWQMGALCLIIIVICSFLTASFLHFFLVQKFLHEWGRPEWTQYPVA